MIIINIFCFDLNDRGDIIFTYSFGVRVYNLLKELNLKLEYKVHMFLKPSLIPNSVRKLREILGPHKTYAVGGVIRDSILISMPLSDQTITKVKGSDWDLATPLRPQEVLSRLRKSKITAIPVGIEHGTVAAILGGVQYEITTFRYDLEYRDGRHPIVRFADSIEEDLERRDFTVNAFALDIDTGDIVDLFHGLEDLRARKIRTVGDPEIRFREDYLRMLRATRFAAKLSGEIENHTFAAIVRNAPRICHVSAERVREEILKLLHYEKPSWGFVLMHESELLRYILPELEMGFGVGQNRFHSHDVANHILLSMDAVSPEYPFERFVTLLHDLGKVPAKKFLKRKGDYVFYSHQYISKRMGKNIMRRLRFSNKDIQKAAGIVENHMYNLKPDLSQSATRRFLRKLGRENVDGFLRMRMADRKGNRLNAEGYEKGIFHFLRNVRKIDRQEDALKVKDLHISGYELMEMGLEPGPVFSTILDKLLEEVLDDPARNNREWLLQRASEFSDEFKRTGTITLPEKEKDVEEEEEDQSQ